MRLMSGSGPFGPILKGVWQSLHPPTCTRNLPRSTMALSAATATAPAAGFALVVAGAAFRTASWLAESESMQLVRIRLERERRRRATRFMLPPLCLRRLRTTSYHALNGAYKALTALRELRIGN